MTDELTINTAIHRLIAAIEKDVREIIFKEAMVRDKEGDFMPPDVLAEARKKRISKGQHGREDDPSQAELLFNDLNWGDYPKILHSLNKGEPDSKASDLHKIAQTLSDLHSVRIGVSHQNSAIESLDFDKVLQACQETFLPMGEKMWRVVNQQLKVLEDDNFQLNAFKSPGSSIEHYLPKEDYFETGFIGRKADIDKLVTKLREGQHGVIQLTGEGGIGKTSLALKVAKTFIEEAEKHGAKSWDQIFYISFKLDALRGIGGVEQIRENVRDWLAELHEQFVGPAEYSEGDPTAEIYEHLSVFRTLLILDNCETISKVEKEKIALQEFIDNLPKTESRILITTRDPDFTAQHYSVSPFKENEALELMVQYSKAKGCTALDGASGKKRKEWARALANNPLAIRWFIDCITAGKDPKTLLRHGGGDIETLLDFLFGNVYETLDECQREIITVNRIAGTSGRLSELQLKLLLKPGFSFADVSKSIDLLVAKNILRREKTTRNPVLTLNEIPKQFARARIDSDKGKSVQIQKAQTKIKGRIENARANSAASKFDIYTAKFESDDEAYVAVTQIQEALQLHKESVYSETGSSIKLDQALGYLEEAAELLPGFSEIHRVRAMILQTKKDDQYLVSEEFENASISANTSHLADIANYHHATFLFSCTLYPEAAEWASRISSQEEFEPQLLRAEINVRTGSLEEAATLFEKLVQQFYEEQSFGPKKKGKLLASYAGCFRAIADRKAKERDLPAAKTAISTGLDLLIKLQKERCLDQLGIAILSKLVADQLHYLSSTSDSESAMSLVSLVNRWFFYPQQIERPIRIKTLPKNISNLERGTEVINLLEIAGVEIDQPRSMNQETTNRSRGTVFRISQGDYDLWGLIECDVEEGEEPETLYFNENCLSGTLKMSQIPNNCRVEFSIQSVDREQHRNNKAVNIKLL